ncbi:type II secretion system protein [Haloferula chungangensis]|uniref:Type II secretion system protein n=1 Tax=Haloferula chungangensis TaxID=1048331 RepID=A0ABW2L5Y5_9BACT
MIHTMKKNLPGRNRGGFTLVELMVTIVIVSVLAALAFALSRKAIRNANSVKDMATMRQIFQTFPLYAADNNGFMPGPANTGVKATYGPQSTGRLSYYIAPYLGYENLERDDFLEAMSYSWQKSAASRDAPCAYLRETVPVGNEEEETYKPFGHPLRAGSDREPKKMSAVFSKVNIARTWILSDLDQQHPDVGNPEWKSEIPVDMSHGNYRLAIFLDGHAGKLNKDNEPY